MDWRLVAPGAWQAVDLLGRLDGHVLFRSEINVLVRSGGGLMFKGASLGGAEPYLAQALFQIHGYTSTVFQPRPLVYLQWFVTREGWLVAALVAAGLWLAFRRLAFPWLAAASLVLIPYALYMAAPIVVPRNLDAALPFACLLGAAAVAGVSQLPRQAWTRRAIVAASVLAIGASGTLACWRLTREHSGYARAAAFVRSHNYRALTTSELMAFYMRGDPGTTQCRTPPVPATLSLLARDRAMGYRYVILDRPQTSVDQYIRDHGRLVDRFLAYGPLRIGENPIASENSTAPNPLSTSRVHIYDISTMPLPPPSSQAPRRCYRNMPL